MCGFSTISPLTLLTRRLQNPRQPWIWQVVGIVRSGGPGSWASCIAEYSKLLLVSLDGTQDRGTPSWRKRGGVPDEGRTSSGFDPALGPWKITKPGSRVLRYPGHQMGVSTQEGEAILAGQAVDHW